MKSYLLSDAGILHKIKKLQYRQQMVATILFVASFIISITLREYALLRYLAAVLSTTGFIFYFITSLKHRYQNRILKPEADALYTPLSGKVSSLKVQDGRHLILLSKSWKKHVEIRSPYTAAFWQGQNLIVALPSGQAVFRFEAQRFIRIPEAQMQAGEVIALMIGSGNCQVCMPAEYPLLVHSGQIIDAGESRLCLRQRKNYGAPDWEQ